MTAYLLDTSSLISVTKFRGAALDNLKVISSRGDDVVVYAVTVAEYYTGIQRGADRESGLIDLFEYWEISRETAALAGEYHWRFARLGRTLTVTDTLIAALARQRRAIVLTENLEDFPMQDIRVMSLAD